MLLQCCAADDHVRCTEAGAGIEVGGGGNDQGQGGTIRGRGNRSGAGARARAGRGGRDSNSNTPDVVQSSSRSCSLTCDKEQILRAQQLDMNPAEAVEKGLGQALAAAPLLQGVLGRKQVEGAGALEGLSQLGDEDLCSVVQHSVQPFQHTLARQVQLIQQHPLPSFDGPQQRPITPARGWEAW